MLGHRDIPGIVLHSGTWLIRRSLQVTSLAWHIWVDLPGDVVFESITQSFHNKAEWEEYNRPEIAVTYTPERLARVLRVDPAAPLTEEIQAGFKERLDAHGANILLKQAGERIEREGLHLGEMREAPVSEDPDRVTLEVRPARPDDYPRVRELIPLASPEWYEDTLAAPQSNVLLVETSQREIIAYSQAWVDPVTGEPEVFAPLVLPQWQERDLGIDRRLWPYSLEYLAGEGYTEATLRLPATSTESRAFVERKGARLVEERAGLRVYLVRTS